MGVREVEGEAVDQELKDPASDPLTSCQGCELKTNKLHWLCPCRFGFFKHDQELKIDAKFVELESYSVSIDSVLS